MEVAEPRGGSVAEVLSDDARASVPSERVAQREAVVLQTRENASVVADMTNSGGELVVGMLGGGVVDDGRKIGV